MATTDNGKKILLVDDDRDFLETWSRMLEAGGYDVTACPSAEEAERKLEEYRPDLAVVDLMMEHEDSGFVLSYHIKRKDSSIPVILVTGVAAETGMEFDSATGEERNWIKADCVLAKPIRYEQLRTEIQRLLGD